MNNIKLWIIVLFIDGNNKTEDKYKKKKKMWGIEMMKLEYRFEPD